MKLKRADNWGIDVGVPDICDRVRYKGDVYRVSSWLKERMSRKTLDERLEQGVPEMDVLLDDVLYEAQQKVHGKKLMFRYRDEATYLGLSGVGGTVAPVTDVEVIGKVNWPEKRIEEARKSAISLLADEQEILF